ncbi:hypothetical protein TELCIR_05916 [Teladorsagia circumcincta]|uniref:CHK kinase-like domain-containing protein n=1 Tax=Teladorsagia circumcincta TaxID=45464 RepID=A0A2G9UPS6_TELCI|nr:hypothetical protein TELCIR_05916 [Teladorsagia circumcincta]
MTSKPAEKKGSFSRVCLMECDSNGRLPAKLIVKYHNTETLFYEHARNVAGVPRIFLSRPLTVDDRKGIICMEHLEGAHTRPVYENISIEEMKSRPVIQAGNGYFKKAADTHSKTYSNDSLGAGNDVNASGTRPVTPTSRKSHDAFHHLLVHGDLYSSNILWQNGIVKAVIDYQMVHYGNPVEDLVRLLTTGLRVSERKAHTTELLDYYRRQITSLIPDSEGSLTVDWLWSCYEKIFPMAGLWAMISLHASFESATSHAPPDSIKLKTVVEKIHGIATEIVEMFS